MAGTVRVYTDFYLARRQRDHCAVRADGSVIARYTDLTRLIDDLHARGIHSFIIRGEYGDFRVTYHPEPRRQEP